MGSSAIATSTDYVIYGILTHWLGITQTSAHLFSASCGMLVNFFLQKRFVFELRRNVRNAFIGALLVSIGGILLGMFIIWLLNHFPFFQQTPFASKICATGVVFFYNFYLKRYVFEKRFIE